MHAHDRTLLASLGFADPDKGDGRHSLGCQLIRCQQEVAIHKGEGQYKTTVGFHDVLLECLGRTGKRLSGQVFRITARVSVEVKVNKLDVGAIARQLELYESYHKVHEDFVYAVALTWDLHADERAVLDAKGVKVIRLGKGFENYCAGRSAATAPSGGAALEL